MQRALWALLWFLLVYYCGPGRILAGLLPRPPSGWSAPVITFISPWLVVWGLICAGLVMGQGDDQPMSAEGALFRAFPIMMLVAAVLLIVTGRCGPAAEARVHLGRARRRRRSISSSG